MRRPASSGLGRVHSVATSSGARGQLAYGFQADVQKEYWLVFDFGGGTFDAALIKAEDDTITVENHGGDNFLGGADIDGQFSKRLFFRRFSLEST